MRREWSGEPGCKAQQGAGFGSRGAPGPALSLEQLCDPGQPVPGGSLEGAEMCPVACACVCSARVCEGQREARKAQVWSTLHFSSAWHPAGSRMPYGKGGPTHLGSATCVTLSPSPASFEPLLASMGSSFWREQDTFNPCGFRCRVGGGGLQFQQCNSVSRHLGWDHPLVSLCSSFVKFLPLVPGG